MDRQRLGAGDHRGRRQPRFDRYPFNKPTSENFYERYMSGEIKEFQTDWVNPTDYETGPLD
jgi:hypothetical protein